MIGYLVKLFHFWSYPLFKIQVIYSQEYVIRNWYGNLIDCFEIKQLSIAPY